MPTLGKEESGFVFLCVFVCLCYQYLAVSLGKFYCDVEEKAAIPGTKVAPLERLKCGCLLLGTSLKPQGLCTPLPSNSGQLDIQGLDPFWGPNKYLWDIVLSQIFFSWICFIFQQALLHLQWYDLLPHQKYRSLPCRRLVSHPPHHPPQLVLPSLLLSLFTVITQLWAL